MPTRDTVELSFDHLPHVDCLAESPVQEDVFISDSARITGYIGRLEIICEDGQFMVFIVQEGGQQ